jgi:SPP1 gp7 family putative phage head morphogenesis protein
MPDFLFEPVPYKEAIDFIKSKPIVSREVFDQLLPELKARAFTITGLEGVADVMQAVRDRIADLPAGANWDDVKSDIADDISPYLVDPNAAPEHRDAQINAANRRAELLLRMHGHAAYAAAEYEINDRQRDVFPYWQYRTMEDDRVRPAHAALDGIVLPADHEFWQSHYPPWDWGCRCTVIPLSESDKDDEEKKDEDKPRDEQNVLVDDPEADELSSTRRLYRDGQVIDVSSPSERGKPGAFEWHPGNLRLSVDDLKGRYDASVWSTFATWAQSTEIEPGHTVWDWIHGKYVPRPAPAIAPTVAEIPARQPISNAIRLAVRDREQRSMITRSLEAINVVHDDGVLPQIPIDSKAVRGALGSYLYSPNGPVRIGIKKTAPQPHLTTLHEIGHFLDHQAIGQPGKFASDSAELEHFRHAAMQSEAIKAIHKSPDLRARELVYYTNPREIWARAYSQYIAQQSVDPRLTLELDEVRASALRPWRQWTYEDFRPIAASIDDIFKKKGWLR